MIVSLIYAQSQNGVIGVRNDLPWRLPADLRHFKELTTGHTIVMGRKTWQSIGKPLPNRRSIVVSRNPDLTVEGADVVQSLDAAFEQCPREYEVFVIGGAELFRAAAPIAQRLYRTVVHGTVDGDVRLPEPDYTRWKLVDSEHRHADEANAYPLTFQRFERIAIQNDPETPE